MAFVSCHEKYDNPNHNLTEDAFAELRHDEYYVSSDEIRNEIDRIIGREGIALSTDKHAHNYYKDKKRLVWISKAGVEDRADTLLRYLKEASEFGLDTKMFRTEQIESDIECVRNLDVLGDNAQDLNVVMARLEYNLTKAYFRYSSGMNFGFVNPDYLFNSLEEYSVDSVTTKFRQLCDLRVKRADNNFYTSIIAKAFNDSVGDFLRASRPKGTLHEELVKRLTINSLTDSQRLKTICNLERCRWRLKTHSDYESYKKYVIVNIPSYTLKAVDGKETLNMRIGVGAVSTKTPLLSSDIMRMDLNPQWIIPKNIAKGMVHSYNYMHRMGMFILDKKLGKLPPEKASYEKIMNREQFIIQAGGPKNSLGRIIFRFDNNFSVFLHDTSTPWMLQRSRRAISHGCVRVEKPLDLALFMLEEKDSQLVERITYSMTVKLVNEKDSLKNSNIDKKKLINSVKIKPSVPVFITYYTVFPDSEGIMREYDDVYGYDKAMIEELSPFVK